MTPNASNTDKPDGYQPPDTPLDGGLLFKLMAIPPLAVGIYYMNIGIEEPSMYHLTTGISATAVGLFIVYDNFALTIERKLPDPVERKFVMQGMNILYLLGFLFIGPVSAWANWHLYTTGQYLRLLFTIPLLLISLYLLYQLLTPNERPNTLTGPGSGPDASTGSNTAKHRKPDKKRSRSPHRSPEKSNSSRSSSDSDTRSNSNRRS